MPGTHATPDDLALYVTREEHQSALEGQSKAIAQEFARLSARITAVEGKPTAPPPAPPPPIVVVPDDPMFEGPILDLPQISGTLDITGKRYRLTSVPSGVSIVGRGELIVPPNLQAGPTNLRIAGAVITGSKPRQQCKRIRESLAAEFGADRITLPLGQSRTSAMIPLDPSKRYGIWIVGQFATGDNALPVEFLRCDAAGNITGVYNPQLPGLYPDNWIALTGSTGLRIRISAARIPGVVGTPTFDLSTIRIYEATNDLAAMPGPYENRSQFYLGAGNTFEDVQFRDMLNTPMKIVGGSGSRFIRPVVRHCLSGFSSQNATGTVFEDSDIDLHCLDDHGDKVPTGIFYRNRALAVGLKDSGARITRGKLSGASWAFEAHENGGPPADIQIDGLSVDAVHCGISNNASNAVVRNARVTMSPLGYIGIECNLSALIENGSVDQDCAAMLSYGIANSGPMTSQQIHRMKIRAGIGMQFWSPDQSPRDILVDGCEIDYSYGAIAWNVPGVTTRGNTGRRAGHYAMRDSTSATLRKLGAANLIDRGGNEWSVA